MFNKNEIAVVNCKYTLSHVYSKSSLMKKSLSDSIEEMGFFSNLRKR